LSGVKYQAKVFRGNLDSTSPERPDVAIFQFNIMALRPNDVKIIPQIFFEYYGPERWNPFLCLSLMDYLIKHQGDVLEDQKQVSTFIPRLREFALLVLLSDQLESVSPEYTSRMVGSERIKDLLKKQCQGLYPHYKTLITNPKWQDNIQSYEIAVRTLVANNELSIVRGRRFYEASKEEVATIFAIPGKRLSNIEPLIENLKHLIVKEDFSGRTSASMVTLRFRLHPLEEDLLGQLENSEEKVRRNGVEVPRLPAELLLRYAKQEGYTQSEIRAILGLMKERRFVDTDAKFNLERRVDNVDDLRDRIQEQLTKVETQIYQLADTLPDFDKSRYSLNKLQTQLEKAQERDELEATNREVLQLSAQLRSFELQRLNAYRQKLSDAREDLHQRVRQGVPLWLSSTFDPSPLQDLLEKQRQDLASEADEEAGNAYKVYTNGEFKTEAEQLWAALHTRYSSQTLSFLNSHRSVGKDIEKFRARVLSWLDRRRDDFEEQCLTYQQLLANAQIKADLRIPFDRERPNESQGLLLTQVEHHLDDYLEKFSEKLRASLQIIRYCIQVQGANLSVAEIKAKQTYENAVHLKKQVTPEILGNLAHFKSLILPLINLADEQKQLEVEIRQATQQRPAEDSELRLMEIFRSMNAAEELDLRGVIISLINQEGTVSLNALMHDLESLFQKNLIDIRIRLSRSE
jgi:hypothetical protein